MAQTIEGFVGNALDDAKISPLHSRLSRSSRRDISSTSSISPFFGSLVPYILQSKFATGPEVAAIGSATIFGMFIGTAGQGQFSDRFGRQFIYQFNLLLFGIFTILGAFAPSVTLLIVCRFIAGHRPRRRTAARLRLCRRIFAQGASAAASWRSCISSAAPACGRSERRWCSLAASRRFDRLARRLAGHRRRRADRLGVPLHAAGIAALSRDPRPRRRGARRAQPPRHRRTERAAHHRRREQHQERSVRRRVHACSRCASSPA